MKPILVFPKPKVAPREKQKPSFPQTQTPGRARQGLRLNSSFRLIKNNFQNGVLSIDPAGFSPERTLVFETIGSVADFYRAASKIQGLDFVQEILGEEYEPDDDFYQLKEGEKNEKQILKGYVYLTMANQVALNKLLTYWENYTKRDNYKFPRGLAPLKYLFDQLHSIRYWDTQDRLRVTGLIEDWRFRQAEGQDNIPVEIELWYRKNVEDRNLAENRVRKLITNIEGEIVKSCIIEDIHYHAVLARIPIGSINEFISDGKDDIEILKCDEIMYFRPTGHCMAPIFVTEDENAEPQEEVIPEENISEINDEPTVALFDGLPLENHEWIKDYLFIDDPEEWSDDYSPADQRHGTSMASLIIRGDMHSAEPPLPRKLYCRPILKPDIQDMYGRRRERIPEDILPIDLVHRAVRRLFEEENDQPPIAPTIKIINLSVADPNRLFEQYMSPWAKLIDYLSEKYQVLFVISAGNHIFDIELGITNKEFNELSAEEKENIILKGIAVSTHTRRLMSPSESINSITVAGYHHDGHSDDEFYNQINPYSDRDLPSTFNPVTWGRKRSIKPEILMPGGRATYRQKGYLDKDPAILEVLTYDGPPGHKVASPGSTGSLNAFSHTFGTSNSTALASRRLCFLNETLQDLYVAQHGEELTREYENVLLKALLCHGASYSENKSRLENLLKDDTNSKRFKSVLAKYLGYGIVDEYRIHGCLDNQATILQCGKINQDDIHTYAFSLPDSLISKSVRRRLIITLSWLSPINATNYTYRQANLYFEPVTEVGVDNPLLVEERDSDWQMVRNGTVQHEVLIGNKASVYENGKKLEISIICKGQAGAKKISVPYGLVVTLDTPDIDLPIYEEIKAGIETEFQIQAKAKQPVKAR